MFSRLVTWKNSRWFCSVLFAVAIGLGHAAAASVLEPLGLSGSVRAAAFDKDKSFEDERGYAVGSVWLQARPNEIAGFKPFLDWRVQGSDLSRTEYSEGDLRELFVEKTYGALDLKIGRQITVWGRADKVNPTDNFSIKDLTLLASDDEDARSGLFAIQASLNFGNYRLIAIWQPEWRAPAYPLAPLPSDVTIRNGDPSAKSDQYGLKLDHSGGETDWSVSLAQVIDRTPDLKVLSSGAGGTSLEFNFQKIKILGADIAKTVGDYGLRAEVAYTETKDVEGNDFLTKNSNFYGVLGVDRTFFGDLNINVQYIYRHTLDWRDTDNIADSNERYLAEQININANQKSTDFHAGSGRVSYKMFNETLELELALAGWFDNGLIRPKVTYAISDSLRAILGAEFYQGEKDSFFGRLKDVSTGFLELRYLF